jgi:hypothetical protein
MRMMMRGERGERDRLRETERDYACLLSEIGISS